MFQGDQVPAQVVAKGTHQHCDKWLPVPNGLALQRSIPLHAGGLLRQKQIMHTSTLLLFNLQEKCLVVGWTKFIAQGTGCVSFSMP